MNWVRHDGSTTFETKSSYCPVAGQGLGIVWLSSLGKPEYWYVCKLEEADRADDSFVGSFTEYRLWTVANRLYIYIWRIEFVGS